MKKLHRLTIVAGMLLVTALQQKAHAQEGKPHNLGNAKDFVNSIKSTAQNPAFKTSGNTLQLNFSNGQSLSAKLNVNISDGGSTQLIGEVISSPGSTFFITASDGNVKGNILLPKQKVAWEYYTENGNAYIRKADINKVVCIDYDSPAEAPLKAQPAPPAGDPIYNLQSFPGATAVVKLDFDGQVVTSTFWNGGNTINALPSNFTAAQIQEIWEMISEDFRPFNLNITTSEAVFNAAPANRRMRCIFTPTNTAAPGSGGVAYVGSFDWGNNTPCWVFNQGVKSGGEAGSHEIGHTVGLSHDGRTNPVEAYFAGHGDWAPIMGVGYYRPIVQWSRGEYNFANQTQDDINIITTQNGFGFRADDRGNTIGTASALVVSAAGTVSAAFNRGVISQRTDVDVFRFTTAGGNVSLAFNPAPRHPDLNISVRLLNSAGGLIATYNPAGLSASFTRALTSGTYYVSIDGVGEGSPATTGYSDYASLGAYTISGTITNPNCVTAYEPNQTLATAKVIPTNINVSAQISNNTDQDWYRITTTASAPNLYVPLTNLAVNYNLQLYSSTGVLLATSANAGALSEAITRNTTVAATYYIRVYGVAGAFNAQCYTVRAATSSSPFARQASLEDKEEQEVSTLSELVLYPNPAQSGQELYINLNTAENLIPKSLRILDLNGQLVSEQPLAIQEGTAVLNLTGISAGMYILDAGAAGKQKLVIE